MENQNKRPENMPRQVKAQQPKLKEEKPGDALPPQQPLTDEEAAPKQPPRWRKIVKKVLLVAGRRAGAGAVLSVPFTGRAG